MPIYISKAANLHFSAAFGVSRLFSQSDDFRKKMIGIDAFSSSS